MLTSDNGRYRIMYGGTTVGSRATPFISPNYCYDGDTGNLVRVCGSNEQWSGEMVDEDGIIEGKVEIDSTLYISDSFLYSFSAAEVDQFDYNFHCVWSLYISYWTVWCIYCGNMLILQNKDFW